MQLGLEAGGAGEVSEVVRASLDGKGPPDLPPSSGPVPLWIVGDGSDASNAAARWGGGWMMGWNLAVARVVQAVGRLGEECHELGRDPAAVRVAAGVVCVLGEDDADAERRRRELGDLSSAPLALTVDSARQMLDDLEAAGATDVVVSYGRRPFEWHPNAGSELWATALLSAASSPEGYDDGERSGR